MRTPPGQTGGAQRQVDTQPNSRCRPPRPDPSPISRELLRILHAGGALVVNVNRRDDQALIRWARAAGRYAYVGRPSPWGNPFHIGRDGDRAQVIERFEEHIRGRPDLLARLPELRGLVLGCWCRPRPCHAGVLVKLLGEAPR
jgi:hypothetical protein